MYIRAKECGDDCLNNFKKLSRVKNEVCELDESSITIASGTHDLKYIKMNGRLQVDLYNYFRRDFNLTSYKLDYVSGYFIGDDVLKKSYDEENETTKIFTKNITGLNNGTFINFEEISHSSNYYKDGKKFEIFDLDKEEKTFCINSIEEFSPNVKVKWGLAKDDVTPQDIFRLTNEGPNERAIIAKYCIQDCNLIHYLLNKIDVLTGYFEMANLCSVPISFLVFRGQGIKLTSYIAKKCREKDTLMPTIDKGSMDIGYEGAIVLEPKSNLYLSNPVACVDYSSLYPSSMISENLSHDSKVWTKTYDLNDNLTEETGEKDIKGNYIYDNLPTYKYVDVTYDTYRYTRKTPSAAAVKVISGYKTCRYAQFPDNKKAIMPSILEELLAARKATKKQMGKETDPFMKNILDKRQLSIKLTANSLYGQTGAKTSTFYELDVAASTTATGRKLLIYAKELIENVYKNRIVEVDGVTLKTHAEYIYGDTDSVFFTFNFHDLDDNKIEGEKALDYTIKLAQEAGELATKQLKKPHDLEYEKTFMPFCLLSKKRYVGMLYELDPNKCKRKSMGIVLKRRDNAPIVKDIYGGIIDILMKEQNIETAIKFLKASLQEIVDEKIPIDKLIISKSIRSYYKNPNQIAHKVLANRMAQRDPGNKPAPGDRIPYVYINTTNKKALQGDKIEHPVYILENKLKINYSFYITNQIMKPVIQVFSLVLEDMKEFKRAKKSFLNKLKTMKQNMDIETYKKKETQLKDKEVEKLLFSEYLLQINNIKNNNQNITKFFI